MVTTLEHGLASRPRKTCGGGLVLRDHDLGFTFASSGHGEAEKDTLEMIPEKTIVYKRTSSSRPKTNYQLPSLSLVTL